MMPVYDYKLMRYIQRNIWRLDANKLIQIIILLW